jgi:hypothetical protein
MTEIDELKQQMRLLKAQVAADWIEKTKLGEHNAILIAEVMVLRDRIETLTIGKSK